MTTELVVISEFDEYRNDLVLMAEKAGFIPDTSTKEGYDKSKRLALDIAKVRIGLEKARKAKKQFHLEGGRAVDAEAKELLEKILSFETPHLEAYKKIDNERKAKQEKLLEDVQDLIRITSTARLEDWDAAKIKACVENLNKQAFVEFDEQQENAEMARDNSVSSLNELYVVVLKKEQDAIDLAKYQKEAEAKAKVEYEEKLKAEARKEAEEKAAKAEQEAKEAEEARLLAVKNAEKAREERIESEKFAAKAAKIAEAQYEKDKKEANKQAEIDKAEAGRIAREEEMQRQVDEKQKLLDEADKREANKSHQKKINNEVLGALVALGADEKLAMEIVIAAARGQIPNVKLSY